MAVLLILLFFPLMSRNESFQLVNSVYVTSESINHPTNTVYIFFCLFGVMYLASKDEFVVYHSNQSLYNGGGLVYHSLSITSPSPPSSVPRWGYP